MAHKSTAHECRSFWCLLCTTNVSVGGLAVAGTRAALRKSPRLLPGDACKLEGEFGQRTDVLCKAPLAEVAPPPPRRKFGVGKPYEAIQDDLWAPWDSISEARRMLVETGRTKAGNPYTTATFLSVHRSDLFERAGLGVNHLGNRRIRPGYAEFTNRPMRSRSPSRRPA